MRGSCRAMRTPRAMLVVSGRSGKLPTLELDTLESLEEDGSQIRKCPS